MNIRCLDIPDVKLLEPTQHHDGRGYFCETWNRRRFFSLGLEADFVQDNQSLCTVRGTVRGLHFQRPPWSQAKLVRVLRGSIFDVAVDLRKDSPSYGRSVNANLSAENMRQLYVPAGFAHGFCAMEDNTVILYKVDAYYSTEHDTGIYWYDHDLGIDWPVTESEACISDRDSLLPLLRNVVSPF